MNKRRMRRAWKYFRTVKPRYFLLAAGVCSMLCVGALRHNNQQMAELRQAVYTADKNGTDVQKPLQELQAYVTAHMNTGLSSGNTSVYPPIQLQHTYERLVAARGESLQASNGKLYSEAQAYCQSLNSSDFSGRNRVPCIQKYVQERGTKLPTVPASLYQFDFVAPKWSPDVAGWSLLATIVLLFLAAEKLVLDRRIKKYLRT